ncbi:metallophosphoesterase [Chitinophaga sp. CC14]
MPATYVIGDIHGALKALDQLIGRLPLRDGDTLIFLGDYVDGWPESAGVINYLMSLESKLACVFIKGNHDISCESWLNEKTIENPWANNAGKATVASYHKLSADERMVHARFFSGMSPYFIDDKNRLFIHAGFSNASGSGLIDQVIYKDRSLWELALTMDKRVKKDPGLFPKKLLQFHEIYIGHTPTLIYNKDLPMIACNVHNIDTGAAFKGKISAMNVDTKEVWQSDAVYLLYPGENGRNP